MLESPEAQGITQKLQWYLGMEATGTIPCDAHAPNDA